MSLMAYNYLTPFTTIQLFLAFPEKHIEKLIIKANTLKTSQIFFLKLFIHFDYLF